MKRIDRHAIFLAGTALLCTPHPAAAQDAGPPGAAPDDLDPSLEPGPGPEPPEVTVQVTRSAQQQLERSADAVSVVDTRKAQHQSADLGEVLARTPGVAVRRDGG